MATNPNSNGIGAANAPDVSLGQATDSPYSQGTPRSDLEASTADGFGGLTGGAPAGYWSRPQGYTGSPANPNAAGSGGSDLDTQGLSDAAAQNLLAEVAAHLGMYASGASAGQSPVSAEAAKVNADQGYGADGNGNS